MTTVRAATESDLEAIREVGHQTWPPTYEPLAGADYVRSGLARWWSAEALLPSIRAGCTLVAEHDGRVVGMASYSRDTDALVVWKLYVVPEAQGGGAGSALMAAAGEAASGCAWLRLAHLEGNERARAFYERRGFRVTGTEPDAAGGPANVWMERPLDQSPTS